MKRQPHIIVIGAGLSGLSVADSLIERGVQVTLYEKKDGPAQGASFSNSGMLHPSQAMPWNWRDLSEAEFHDATHAVYDLAITSCHKISKKLSELDLKDANRPKGCIKIFDSRYLEAKFLDLYRQFNIIYETEKHFREPFSDSKIVFPQDASGNAFDYCIALEQDIIRKGARIIYGVNPISLIHKAGKIIGINTGNEIQFADHVVLACGLGTSRFLEPFGIDVGLYPERGFAVDFEKPTLELPARPVMHHESHSSLTVFENHIRFSGTIGQLNETYLLDTWKNLLPELFETLNKPQRIWSAERPMSSLGRPLIGQTKIDNLWVNAGHGHMGWTLSAGAGSLLSKMILEGLIDERFALPATTVSSKPNTKSSVCLNSSNQN